MAAAPQHDVLATGGLLCLLERGLDSVGDEVERGPSLHLHRITRVMGEDEHVPAHHPGADVLSRLLEYRCALVHLAPLLAVGSAPGGQRNHPVMEPLATLAERVLL